MRSRLKNALSTASSTIMASFTSRPPSAVQGGGNALFRCRHMGSFVRPQLRCVRIHFFLNAETG
eukprot:1118258-Pleurochrysis_carterae.AAC.2